MVGRILIENPEPIEVPDLSDPAVRDRLRQEAQVEARRELRDKMTRSIRRR